MTSGTKKFLSFIALALVIAVITILVNALLVNIVQRKLEAKSAVVRLVEVDENTTDPAIWGKNYPQQYDAYKRTVEPTRTKYGGGVGAEGSVPEQKAKKDPWLTRMFSGYLFSIDYRDRRGHGFMLEDQEKTQRNTPGKQSGNCLHCHASIIPLYRDLGKEALPDADTQAQIQEGLKIVGDMDYWKAHDLLKTKGGLHPVSCVDCHDPRNNDLRVTRPGFLTGIAAFAASGQPAPHLPSVERWRKGDRRTPYNPNMDGTRQEMRSFVCGQCHVEYFCGKGATVFFPWSGGLKVEQIENTYDNMTKQGHRFKDWVHAETGAEVLKAQHPEFEMWSQGIHARNGVSCADCHMPYMRAGASKISEHWVRSPLLMVNRSCQPCHPYSESQILEQVEKIQDRHYALMHRAGGALADMLDAFKVLRGNFDASNLPAAQAKAEQVMAANPEYQKAPPGEQATQLAAETRKQLTELWHDHVYATPALKEVAELQRQAQWRLDFVAAENSMGFHAPQEMARILGESIDLSRQAEIKARDLRK